MPTVAERTPVRARAAALVIATTTGLTACTADPATTDTAAPAPSTVPAAPGPQDEVGDVPVVPGGEYDRALAEFGADQVAAATTNAARVARLALADCHRWTTGQVDPRMTALVTPDVLAAALEQLERTPSYGAGPVPSLLSHLPEDDGNGHDLASDVRAGCEGDGPLRYDLGPLRVSVAGGDRPGLVVAGEFAMNVRIGGSVVSAGQDWVFTMEPGPDLWRLADVEPVMANVNWAPARGS
jgi:hypothetical protein